MKYSHNLYLDISSKIQEIIRQQLKYKTHNKLHKIPLLQTKRTVVTITKFEKCTEDIYY